MKGIRWEIKVIAEKNVKFCFHLCSVWRSLHLGLSFVSVSTGICLRLKSQKVMERIYEMKPTDFKDQIDEYLPQCRDEIAELLFYT